MDYYPHSAGRKLTNTLVDFQVEQEKQQTNLTISCSYDLKESVYRLAKSEGAQISPFGRSLFERVLHLKDHLGEKSILTFLSNQSQILSDLKLEIREAKKEVSRLKTTNDALEKEKDLLAIKVKAFKDWQQQYGNYLPTFERLVRNERILEKLYSQYGSKELEREEMERADFDFGLLVSVVRIEDKPYSAFFSYGYHQLKRGRIKIEKVEKYINQ